MKTWKITIKDLALDIEAEYKATTKGDAEAMARNDYSIELDCAPEDVNIIKIEEKTEEKKMKNITADVVMKYIPKKSQAKIAELTLEDLGKRRTRYNVELNEGYWLDGKRSFQIENFKELLVTLKEKVVFDETPEPWLEADPLDVHKPDTMSKTAYEKQMRKFFRDNMAGNTEEITFKEWFADHMAGLEADGKIVKETKNGKVITLVMA